MKPLVTNWQDPPLMDSGASEPSLFLGRNSLYCAYHVSQARENLSFGAVAVLRFDVVLHLRFGCPGDETLHSHPLYESGLKHYAFWIVESSPLIAELEERNRVHPRHVPGMYSTRFKHFVATFHDETLEVVAEDGVVLGRSDLAPDQAVIALAQPQL
jgi:hypothetical protein